MKMNDSIIVNIRKLQSGCSAVLTLSDGSRVKMPFKAVTGLNFRVGDPANAKELINRANIYMAKETAVRMLSVRDYSKKELFDKLVLRGYEKETVENVVEELTDYGYIEEQRYIDRTLHNLLSVKRYSKKMAYHKLIEKGIDSDTARNALDNANVNEQENITAIIDKNKMKNKRSVGALLNRYGYEYADYRRALDIYYSENEDEYAD